MERTVGAVSDPDSLCLQKKQIVSLAGFSTPQLGQVIIAEGIDNTLLFQYCPRLRGQTPLALTLGATPFFLCVCMTPKVYDKNRNEYNILGQGE